MSHFFKQQRRFLYLHLPLPFITPPTILNYSYIYIHRYLLTKRQLIGIEMNMQFRTLTIVIDRLAASEREIQMEMLKIKT